ncbi:hypothetical protein THAR02_04440 [Trichoderma harzianum]|uniref:Ecp2 effector protein domain-containing protein n=1 Tax=Trichoderma harzianum TaxID=5544 RepID=A0A0F9XEF0_TRIHA|nr:hypothetical protein THAR02_04440 [Trichoderma harzianum]
MQLKSCVIAALGFAITAAADEVICFPQPSQNITLPQSILDLDTSVKLNWATALCNQLTFPADAVETALTPLEDGIEAPEDGHIWGVELNVQEIRTLDNCIVNAHSIFSGACPGGALLTLSGPLTQFAIIAKLN